MADTAPESDGRRVKGRRTRAAILGVAADVASVEGLEGLTIGRLATELRMSKSGLFAHFGSKEELQLATIAAAREVFADAVVVPSRAAVPGLPQLRALVAAWLTYLRDEVFAGGCFFVAVRAEFDSRRPGAVRDAVAADLADWERLLARHVTAAVTAGHLREDVEPEGLRFEIDALGSAANVRFQLTGDPEVFALARTSIEARLRAASAVPAW